MDISEAEHERSISHSLNSLGSTLGFGRVLVPQLERFAPPDVNYQPTWASVPIPGDFVWGFAKIVQWPSSTPSILADVLAQLGVPEPIPTILMSLCAMSFAVYIIYIIANRVVF